MTELYELDITETERAEKRKNFCVGVSASSQEFCAKYH